MKIAYNIMILRFWNIVCEYFGYKSDIDAGRHDDGGENKNTRTPCRRLLFSHQRIVLYNNIIIIIIVVLLFV